MMASYAIPRQHIFGNIYLIFQFLFLSYSMGNTAAGKKADPENGITLPFRFLSILFLEATV